MIWTHSGQVISETSRSTVGDPEVMNARSWLENNMMPSDPPTIREFRLELVGNTNEILIESTERDSLMSVEREIAAHKLIDFT
jgi:hypothetical protein